MGFILSSISSKMSKPFYIFFNPLTLKPLFTKFCCNILFFYQLFCIFGFKKMSNFVFSKKKFTSLVHLFIVTVTLSVWPIKNCCCPDDTSIATMIAWHGYTMQEPFFVHKALNKKEIPESHTIFFLHIWCNTPYMQYIIVYFPM